MTVVVGGGGCGFHKLRCVPLYYFRFGVSSSIYGGFRNWVRFQTVVLSPLTVCLVWSSSLNLRMLYTVK